MKPKRLALVVALFVFLVGGRAFADEVKPLPEGHVRLTTGNGELIAPNGDRYFLPVGTHILDGTSWENLDGEHRRLQEQETRLKAENRSLRNSANEWSPGWRTVVFITAGALAIGFTAERIWN